MWWFDFSFFVGINASINNLSVNFTKWSNTSNNLSAIADKLFEYVWPFCGVGALRVKT